MAFVIGSGRHFHIGCSERLAKSIFRSGRKLGLFELLSFGISPRYIRARCVNRMTPHLRIILLDRFLE